MGYIFPFPRRILVALIAAGVWFTVAAPVHGEVADGTCRTIEVEMTPAEKLQMVIWLEDSAGNYVDTLFITQLTGRYGLGNRPGRMDFNSGLLWPYGRRISTFPVWAHRHGLTFPEVVFQNDDSNNLSHPLGQSSVENLYCRPIQPTEPLWDAMSCATTVYTDKGKFHSSRKSLYPPRSDLTRMAGTDDESVAQMAAANPFDSVSQATPAGGEAYVARYSIPLTIPNGDYMLFAEVAKEFDQNTNYDFPAPVGIPWSSYGAAYRGQPSVIYQVPVTILDGESSAKTLDYAGYGDPDGLDGNIRVPDSTITTTVPGSGSARLLLTVDSSNAGEMYRLRVHTRAARDEIPPGTPGGLTVTTTESRSVTFNFVAPGEDNDTGRVSEYEIRYQAGAPITIDNFDSAIPLSTRVVPADPGTIQTVTITGLIPQTHYYIAVRAVDDCLNRGALESFMITTQLAEPGEVDYCFVATAAYGSLLANDVVVLRKFRDIALRGHIGGELAVAGYYTFGPALARLIKPSETGRGLARQALAPLVSVARSVVAAAISN